MNSSTCQPQVRPYGSWKSPVTSDLIVAGTVGLAEVSIDGDNVYWIESRPSESGRSVLVRRSSDGRTTDVTPPGFNTRTTVHEYGGGSYLVADDVVYFSNFSDQQIYRCAVDGVPEPLTNDKSMRYADGVIDRKRNRLISVREDHSNGTRDSVNTVVTIDLASGSSKVIVSGNDFYSTPRLSPDGKQLAWLAWNHPNLPWDGNELWTANLNGDGSLGERRLVAGGGEESVFQPEWSPDGVLHFVSDRKGWWNLYRFRAGNIEPLCEMEAEFGAPQWVFRMSTYAFTSRDRIVCSYSRRGTWKLASLDTRAHELEPVEIPCTEISYVRASGEKVVFCGGSPSTAPAVVALDLASRTIEVLKKSTGNKIDDKYLSIPRSIEFPTEGGLTSHGFFYPPANGDFAAPPGERPPLIVISHGGPTSATSTTFRLSTQFWTSRGFGVLDVNYGGSTGYGREYRKRLNGQWGVVDVDDCVNGAKFLAAAGEVDAERLIIRGGSAGGYTTLAALAFRNVFKAGASYYGISDLEALEEDCHKFESQYNHSLVGPYPQRKDLYKERSPIYAADRLSCPLILFQGLEDKVVPPNQSEIMFDAVLKKGIPVAYVAFEGEQHGFRKAENIKRSLDGELYFYSRVFNFELAEPVEPVKIENL